MVTGEQLLSILAGTELSGNLSQAYEASYAVGNAIYGVSRGNNASGISFGVVQLDIGNNSFAQSAYREVLVLGAVSFLQLDPESFFNDTTYRRLLSYNGVQRPDLDEELVIHLKSDRKILTQIFNLTGAKSIIDKYTAEYLESDILPEINKFLSDVTGAWDSETVFDSTHPDYPTALAAISAIKNRTGSIAGTRRYFLANQPITLDDVRDRFNAVLPARDWHLVEIGGALYRAGFGDTAECFLPHTPILLADGTTKPIEAIRPEDSVMAYDNRGNLVPRRVTRTFVNDVAHVLDFHGTGVTPGQVFLCGAGRFARRHVPLIDILRDDGAVVRHDGSLMRAATGCAVGSDADRLIEVVGADGTTARLRAGTRVPVETGEVTVGALIARAGGTICDGGVSLPGAPAPQPFAWAGSLPAPEDYVLRQSGLTLAEIYAADEWESPPQMAAALDFSTTPRSRPAPRHRVHTFEVERSRACL